VNGEAALVFKYRAMMTPEGAEVKLHAVCCTWRLVIGNGLWYSLGRTVGGYLSSNFF
jgi:hypothetical protein